MLNPLPKNLGRSVNCEYCSGALGHDTEKCWKLKTVVQELIDTHWIKVHAPETPNINQNLLPAHHETHMIELIHKGWEAKKLSQTMMMICSSETNSKEMVTNGKSVVQRKEVDNKPTVVAEKGSSSAVAVKPEKAKVVVPGVTSKPVVVMKGAHTESVILKPATQLPVISNKVVPWNYERVTVTYQRKEVREKVCETHVEENTGSDLALIITDLFRRAPSSFDEDLDESHVLDKISVNHLEKIANKIFEVNRVTFSDDELPMEGIKHNRSLYLMVKCEDSVVTQVLVDNGSSENIFPFSTLNNLQVEDERIYKNSICVRGLDGGGKDSVGDIVLELTIGPVEFTMEFQEIVVHGEDNLCVPNGDIVPFIEVDNGMGPWVYQVSDTVLVEKITEGKCVPTRKMAAPSVMVAVEMLKNGFVPGKGLGTSLQGIVQPVSLPRNLDTFGLGFKPTVADMRRSRKMKKKAWALPKPVPCLSRLFVRPGTRKQLLSRVPGPLIGADGDLEKGFERLSAEVNMA
ncbi:uncharacterized protein [Nicotiana sylvestris]|uniref:uncharacterized protein n=1 Tax=Nicotiana sylvestris TaxID=4096 RepID=UPI00388CCC23